MNEIFTLMDTSDSLDYYEAIPFIQFGMAYDFQTQTFEYWVAFLSSWQQRSRQFWFIRGEMEEMDRNLMEVQEKWFKTEVKHLESEGVRSLEHAVMKLIDDEFRIVIEE